MRRLLLLSFGVLVGLLIAEAALRMATHVRCEDDCQLSSRPDRFYGWGHIPDEEGWCQACLNESVEWRTFTHINALGLRDRAIPYVRRDAFRILVLGDSFTEGVQVDQERTFPKLLEQRLNAEKLGPVEVINTGVWGWGTDNELLFFLNEGWKYRADLVLLAFFTGNDVFENHQLLMRRSAFSYPDKPYFEIAQGRLVRRNFPLPPEGSGHRVARVLRDWMRHHVALFRFLSALQLPHVPRAAAAAAPVDTHWIAHPGQVYLQSPTPEWREAWSITRGLILRLRREVETRGSRFAVVVINGRDEITDRWRWILDRDPLFHASAHDFDRANRLLTQFLDRRRIAFIPLLPDFRARFGADGGAFFQWDTHFAPAGHEAAAELIARGLRERGLIGPGNGHDAVAAREPVDLR